MSDQDALFGPDGTPTPAATIRPSEAPDFREGRHKRPDWSTSVAGANAVAYRAGSQKAKLLTAFRDAYPHNLTDEEAAERAGISLSSEFSKRCGELRQDGHIAVVRGEDREPITREGASGIPRLVSIWQETPTPAPNRDSIQRRARNPREAVMLTEEQATILIEGQPSLIRRVARVIEDTPTDPETQAQQVVRAVADWLTSYRPPEFGDEFCTPLDVTAFILRRGEPRD
jgi:hypothetical protein